MRRFMMIVGGTVLVLGSSLVAAAQDKAPTQSPEKQVQAPVQAPIKAPEKQAPAQAPTQKMTPVQKPVQAPTQKSVAQCQSPVQKGEMPVKTARFGRFHRYD